MPRIKPLPKSELSICARVVEFRNSHQLTRASVAVKTNANRHSLANVEAARAPVGFIFGYNLCATFNVSLRWLALGKLPKVPFTPVSESILAQIPNRITFLSAYQKYLANAVESRLQELAEDVGVSLEDLGKTGTIIDQGRAGVSLSRGYFETIIGFLKHRAEEMDDDQRIAFAHRLNDVAFSFWSLPDIAGGKQQLTPAAKPAENLDVSSKEEIPTWKQLVAKLKKLTETPGTKTRLAADIGTSRQNIHKWLTLDAEPGAELTLKVYQWVIDREK